MVHFIENPVMIGSQVTLVGYNPTEVTFLVKGYHGKNPPSDPNKLSVLAKKHYTVEFSWLDSKKVILEDELFFVDTKDKWYLEVWCELQDRITGITRKERTGVFSFYLGGVPPFIIDNLIALNELSNFRGITPLGALQSLNLSEATFQGILPKGSNPALNQAATTFKGEMPLVSMAKLVKQ